MDEVRVRVLQLHTPGEIRAELERVGADSSLPEKIARSEFRLLKLECVSLSLARLLYQELVMEGGLVVTAPRLDHAGAGETDVLLCATRYQLEHLLVRLRWQPSAEFSALADDLERALDHFTLPPPALELGSTRFEWNRTHIMGILNVTPDSFSGDGLIRAGDTSREILERVITRAKQLEGEGADILDLGGASSHPHAGFVDAATELERVVPVLRALKNETALPLSVDTAKAVVADAALDAGAALVNDVTGLRGDAGMARVVASHNAAVVILHNGKPDPAARDFIGVIVNELRERIQRAHDAGIAPARILIDPGLGFGKTLAQNLELLDRLGELRVLGCPILIGPSRKGFISQAIGAPPAERGQGTAAAVAVGIVRGANVVRVHDVERMVQVARMTDAILSQSSTL